MSLSKVRWLVLVAVPAILAGCASASGERSRLADLPLAATQAEVIFSITTGARMDAACGEQKACDDDAAIEARRRFVAQVERLAETLQKGVHKVYPDLAQRCPNLSGGRFDVHLVAGDEAGSASSPNGRIAIHEALASLHPDDRFVAFVIAREMGHVIARHEEENSATSMITSLLLNLAVPGSSLLKSAVSAVGSRLAASGKRDEQAIEADAIAYRLLKGSGFRLRDVSKSVTGALASLDDGSWAQRLRKSSDSLLAEERRDRFAVAAVRSGKPGEAPARSYRIAAAAGH
ncbi:MAG: M48 family metalloprotease [Bacteroidota bacterium]